MDRIPKQGEFYRHFKNRMYQVLQIATHTETGEILVIYQALYGDYGVYARPLEQFAGPVDHEKYPAASQEYRFEKVVFAAEAPEKAQVPERAEAPEKAEAPERAQAGKASGGDEGERPLSPFVLEFLDTQTYEEKLLVLDRMKGKVEQRDLDSLYLALDLTPGCEADETQERQLEGLKQYVRMRRHYDASRLRRR